MIINSKDDEVEEWDSNNGQIFASFLYSKDVPLVY